MDDYSFNEGLPESAQVWNRACGFGKFDVPAREGDRALEALLFVHGLVMNGGLGHAYDIAETLQMEEAIAGFRFFGLNDHADLLVRISGSEELQQEELSPEYSQYGEDDVLTAAFEQKFESHRELFAPLHKS